MTQTTINDPILGSLKYDPSIRSYAGTYAGTKPAISIQLSVDTNGDPAKAISRATAVLASFESFTRQACDYAVERLLKLKNDSWLDEGEEELTPAEFKERMELEALHVDPDGSVTFYHRDGDLFWGHYIEIRMDELNRFVHADIPG